jgi:predicted permease
MRRFWLKLRRRRRLEADLEAELAFHREMSTAHGHAIPFGNRTSITEQARDLWRFTVLENLWRDVVYGMRGLAKRPALLTSAVLSLALGIGANTAIFSLAVELLLSQPSVTDAESIAYVRIDGNSHSSPEALEALRQGGLFADVAGENEEIFLNWNDGTRTRPIFGVVVTKNYFSMLGVPVERGRGILPQDPEEVAVLADHFWRRHLNADPSVVGGVIHLEGRPYTVLGVLPPAHRTLIGYGYSPDVYVPHYLDTMGVAIYARLRHGMSIEQGRAGAAVLAAGVERTLPAERRGAPVNIRLSPIAGWARLQEQGSDVMSIAVFFVALLVVVTLVLLIACVNVAGLLLARASTRRREITIRLALGAGRRRLLQQLLVESLLLSVMGTVSGLLLARVLASSLGYLRLPIPLPLHLRIEPDWRVVSYAAGLLVLATLACGLLPAWQSVKESLAPDLHRERKLYLRRTLLVGQVAVSFIVLTTAVLFVRNLLEARAISPGFDVHATLRASVNLPPAVYTDRTAINRYVGRALEALMAIPGIEAAAAARVVPFNQQVTRGYEVVFAATGEKQQVRFQWNAVTSEYFRVMSIPIRRGRAFRDDDDGTPSVVIVNQTFADRFLAGKPPVGVEMTGLGGSGPSRIVGVVNGTKNMTIGEDDRPQLYEPLLQIRSNRQDIQFVLRSTLPPAAQINAVHAALRDVEPAAGLEVATMFSSIGLAFLPSQVGAALMSGVGGLGLLLVAVGLSGTLAYSVTRRTREIGLRLAVGATPASVSRMILGEAGRLLAIGAAAGLAITWFITGPLGAFFVPGVTPRDPLSFAVVIVVMGMTGLFAAWGPARRAAAVDPIISLRHE